MTNKQVFEFNRGEVYLVQEGRDTKGHEQKKTRWWVLVGATPINRGDRTILAIPLTSNIMTKPPFSIKVMFNNQNKTALITQLRALTKTRFLQIDGTLNEFDMNCIDDALKQVLSLSRG